MTSNDPNDLRWSFILGIISRVQAKSFTKALNALLKEEDEIKNLFSDLKDGKKLIKVVRHFTGADLVSLTLFDPKWPYSTPYGHHLVKYNLIAPCMAEFGRHGLILPHMIPFDPMWPVGFSMEVTVIMIHHNFIF